MVCCGSRNIEGIFIGLCWLIVCNFLNRVSGIFRISCLEFVCYYRCRFFLGVISVVWFCGMYILWLLDLILVLFESVMWISVKLLNRCGCMMILVLYLSMKICNCWIVVLKSMVLILLFF